MWKWLLWVGILWMGTACAGAMSASPGETPAKKVTPAAPAGVQDPDLVLVPGAFSAPAVGETAVDPQFGTTLRRLTDTGDRSFGTHIYSQLQAFSADNQHILLIEDGWYVVRRRDNLALVLDRDDTAAWNAPRWHPTQPNILLHFDSNGDTTLRLQQTTFTNQPANYQTSTLYTFPATYQRIRVNQSFDEVSRDGRWLAGMASLSDGDQMLFSLNLETGSLGAQLRLSADLYGGPCDPDPTWGEVEPDWVGVSPLGRYLVVQWTRDGTTRCSGLETFAIESGAFVGRPYDGHQHGDLGITADEQGEFFMTFELYHPSGNLALGVRDLPGPASGVGTPEYVQVLDWVGDHISCQGPPGVCLVTTLGDDSNGWSALEGELFLQYLDGSVERLAHHRSSNCGYWVQPRGSLSRDGRFAIFATDWGTANCSSPTDLGAGDAYLLDLDREGPPPTFTPTAWLYLPIVSAGVSSACHARLGCGS